MPPRPSVVVEPWPAAFGASVEAGELEPSGASVDETVELAVGAWRPLRAGPGTERAACVHFVDGVRRIDARVWLTGEDGATRLGLCASYAAGVARCDTAATIERVEVRRGLFTTGGAAPLVTGAGSYQPRAVADDGPEQLAAGLQERMRALEVTVARAAPRDADLVLVDGPLRERQDLPHAVGYVKTHHVAYLTPAAHAVVAALAAGERSPLFVTQTSWSRYSWYLRLPGGSGHPWAGVVRCEASADLAVAQVRALADLTCVTLPRFASAPHKDARAPQNLYPIAALERELRRRLGDVAHLERQLRLAASAT